MAIRSLIRPHQPVGVAGSAMNRSCPAPCVHTGEAVLAKEPQAASPSCTVPASLPWRQLSRRDRIQRLVRTAGRCLLGHLLKDLNSRKIRGMDVSDSSSAARAIFRAGRWTDKTASYLAAAAVTLEFAGTVGGS